jgi:hypothetical protein
MALIDVLYWLDVYYQTVLSAVILRTQVLERKLGFGLDTYISRFYMRHKIGKALHLLHIGFLASLLILGVYAVLSNDLVSQSGISLPVWILLLLLPIFFIFCIWGFFDRTRYRTYRKAQEKISNYLRKPGALEVKDGEKLEHEIIEFLDSDKEDLGLDLKSNEWVYFDEIETKWWLRLWLWSRRLIVTNQKIYVAKTRIGWKWISFIDYYNLSTPDDSNNCATLKAGFYPEESDGEKGFFKIENISKNKIYFSIKLSKEVGEKINKQIEEKNERKNGSLEQRVKPKITWNKPFIATVVSVALVLVVVLGAQALNDQFRLYQKPAVQVSAEPRIANFTVEANEMVSKRIRLSFSEPTYLTKVNSETPLNIDQNLDLLYNSTIKTNEHFFYIIIDNSRFTSPQGDYEGIIRVYYSIDQNDNSMNIAVPLNIAIVE